MSWIDFVLNIAGALIWLNWCSLRLGTPQPAAVTLAGTLKPAGRDPFKSWRLLGGLLLLVLLKSILYWQLNSSAEWPPRLDLGVIVLAFPVGTLPLALLFSVASLVRMLVIVYTWLLTLLLLGRTPGGLDPVQRVIAIQFGPLARWPWWALLLLPPATIVLLWLGAHPLLVHAGVVESVRGAWTLLWQGFLVGGAVFLSLKFLLPAILLLYLISSYVYLGIHPFWDFVAAMSRVLLKPVQRLPLRSGKMDFAPLAGMLLLLLLLHALPEFLLGWAVRHNVPVWPQ